MGTLTLDADPVTIALRASVELEHVRKEHIQTLKETIEKNATIEQQLTTINRLEARSATLVKFTERFLQTIEMIFDRDEDALSDEEIDEYIEAARFIGVLDPKTFKMRKFVIDRMQEKQNELPY